jgi:hypothetical protein
MMSGTLKNLISLFQKLDYRDKRNSGKKKLIGILTAYLFSNTALSYNFFMFFDDKSYIILSLSSNLFLILLLVLNDFENLFLGRKSQEILTSLPLKSSELFLSKFISAMVFLFFFIFASSLPQVVFFYFKTNSILITLSFFLTNILFCYSLSGLIIIAYSFVLKNFTRKAPFILNVIQIIFFIFIFYSTSLSSRHSTFRKEFSEKIDITLNGFVKYLPQTFYSESVYAPAIFILCLVITGFVFILLYRTVAGNYDILLKKAELLDRKKKSLTPDFRSGFLKSFRDKFILRNNYESASYYLVRNQLKSSGFLKAKYWPVAIMPVLLATVGLVSGIKNLLFFNNPDGSSSVFNTAVLVLSPSISFTLMMSSRILISNTRILDEGSSGTEWIYLSLPLPEASRLIKGSYKYIYMNFIFPSVILLVFLIGFKFDMFTVLLNIFFIVSGIYFVNTIALIFDKTFPFTLESTKFNSASKFLDVFAAMFLGLILFLIQIFVFQNIIFVAAVIAVFLTLSFLINRN